jgi:hypothetical protein
LKSLWPSVEPLMVLGRCNKRAKRKTVSFPA